jgi:hypothetical protein
VLAHGSGIDDLLIAVAGVGAYLAVSAVGRVRRSAADRPAVSACPYCDARVAAERVRCEVCGFRVPRAGGAEG